MMISAAKATRDMRRKPLSQKLISGFTAKRSLRGWRMKRMEEHRIVRGE